MELQSDRTEVTLRLLHNGRYVWTITSNTANIDTREEITHLKQLDGALRDAFPNHVKENSVKFSEFQDE
jgi:hypothetical protein